MNAALAGPSRSTLRAQRLLPRQCQGAQGVACGCGVRLGVGRCVSGVGGRMGLDTMLGVLRVVGRRAAAAWGCGWWCSVAAARPSFLTSTLLVQYKNRGSAQNFFSSALSHGSC